MLLLDTSLFNKTSALCLDDNRTSTCIQDDIKLLEPRTYSTEYGVNEKI